MGETTFSRQTVQRRVTAALGASFRGALALLLALGLAACTRPGNGTDATTSAAPTTTTVPGEPAPVGAANILVFGDSLSAAYGLAAEQGWVALLDQRLRTEQRPFRMVNASISGETTAGGVSRLDAALALHRPAIVVLALGANDGLRGLPLAQSHANLQAMIDTAAGSGAEVLLVGMRLPPNLGPDYTRDFFAMYPSLATSNDTALLPFLLEPIALDDAAFQDDRLHPTAEAQPVLAEHVWTALAPLLVDRPQ